jgi:tetratricopeptide (TPR) repeat protein
VQLIYLVLLLAILSVGVFLVLRQVLLRRDLENAAKELGERARSATASADDHFELGCVLLRKKVFGQAQKNLETALKMWPPADADGLAQVQNALGYAKASQGALEGSLVHYRAAVQLSPGYVTAWNNLGDALEKQKAFAEALEAYSTALSYAPDNPVASERATFLRTRRVGI